MNANLLITQIFDRSDAILYLWCVLLAVGLAVLIAAAHARHPSLPHLLFLGFAFTALTHLMCLQWLVKQWAASTAALHSTDAWRTGNDAVKTELMTVIEAPHFGWILPFHFAFDAFVLYGIWRLSRRPNGS